MSTDGYGRHTPVLSGTKIVRVVSIDATLIPHVSDALINLTDSSNWVEIGDSVDDIVAECFQAIEGWYGSVNIGQIVAFIGTLPPGWLAMDGSTYSGADYPELFDLIDNQFKDIGQNEFTLPDLGGLFTLGSGGSFVLGNSGGAVSVILSVDELPSHNHSYIQPVANVDLEAPGAPDILAAGVGPGDTTGNTGGGEAHENMPPYIVLNYGCFSGRI